MEDGVKERYKLQDAAEILAQGNTEGCSKILINLRKSVQDGNLNVYRPGSTICYEPKVDDESYASREATLLRSDVNIMAGGLTWADREFDEKLHEVLYQIPDNLEAYWDKLNTWIEENEPRLDYRFSDPGIPTVPTQIEPQNQVVQQPVVANWKMSIQAQAAIIWHKYINMGCSPTKNNIKTELATWCRDTNTTTKFGLIPSENYIYRHVLREWKPPK